MTGPERLRPLTCLAKEVAFAAGGREQPRQVRAICSGGW